MTATLVELFIMAGTIIATDFMILPTRQRRWWRRRRWRRRTEPDTHRARHVRLLLEREAKEQLRRPPPAALVLATKKSPTPLYLRIEEIVCIFEKDNPTPALSTLFFFQGMFSRSDRHLMSRSRGPNTQASMFFFLFFQLRHNCDRRPLSARQVEAISRALWPSSIVTELWRPQAPKKT